MMYSNAHVALLPIGRGGRMVSYNAGNAAVFFSHISSHASMQELVINFD